MNQRTYLALLAVLVGLGSGGCSPQKQSTPAPAAKAQAAKNSTPAPATNTSSSAGNPLTAPVDYLGAVANAKRVALKTVDLASLTRSIQLFEAQEDRFPKDLNELVTMRYLPALPTPPPGMRISYNPGNGKVALLKQ
jgi:hypothetical protein